MPGNLGRRLYANLWEAASPVFARGLRTGQSAPTFNTGAFNDSFHAFFAKNGIKKLPPRAQITRRFASGGFLVIGASPSSGTAVETGATCVMAPEKIICHGGSRYFDGKISGNISRNVWRRNLHTSKDQSSSTEAAKSRNSSLNEKTPIENQKPNAEQSSSRPSKTSDSIEEHIPPTPLNKNLRDRLPHLPHLHRPSKEELLAAANGFWSRLKVRFKWFSIRSVRPFNFDEITALFSWVLLGHLIWVVVGTTTFFSLLILAINTVFAQGMFFAVGNCALTDIFRNACRMDRKLPDQVFWCQGCVRVRYCT